MFLFGPNLILSMLTLNTHNNKLWQPVPRASRPLATFFATMEEWITIAVVLEKTQFIAIQMGLVFNARTQSNYI